MRRSRRVPSAKQPPDLRVEKDSATGVVPRGSDPAGGKDAGIAARTPRSPRARYSQLKLPHERDESTHRPGKPNEVTTQAATDLASGTADTDCYGAAGTRFDRKRGR